MGKYDNIDIFFIAVITAYFVTLACIIFAFLIIGIKSLVKKNRRVPETLPKEDITIPKKTKEPKKEKPKTKKVKERIPRPSIKEQALAIIRKLFMKEKSKDNKPSKHKRVTIKLVAPKLPKVLKKKEEYTKNKDIKLDSILSTKEENKEVIETITETKKDKNETKTTSTSKNKTNNKKSTSANNKGKASSNSKNKKKTNTKKKNTKKKKNNSKNKSKGKKNTKKSVKRSKA